AVGQQAVGRTGLVGCAGVVRAESIAVGVVTIRLVGVGGVRVIGAQQFVAIIVVIRRGAVDVGQLRDSSGGVVLQGVRANISAGGGMDHARQAVRRIVVVGAMND